jgi:hypothetical protein
VAPFAGRRLPFEQNSHTKGQQTLVTVVWLTILMPQIKLLKFNKILDFYAGNNQVLCKSRAGLHQSKPITMVALNIIDKNQ